MHDKAIPMDSKTPLAIVTGASRRLGKELALGFARKGYAIGLHFFTSSDDADETAIEINDLGSQVLLLPADLRDTEQIRDIFTRIPQDRFRLEILVNSAAEINAVDITRLTVAEWDNTLDLNLRAPWLLSIEAAKFMQAAGGSIINITDTGTDRVWPSYGAYLVSKSGLEMLTKLLAKALAPCIRVNGIAPGLILPPDGKDSTGWNQLVDRIPLKKHGQPADIVEAAIYLASSKYITGEILTVDGGFRLV